MSGGNPTGILKLDKKNSSATNENYVFSLIVLKYIHMTICKAICPRTMFISALLRMQKKDYVKVNIIALKLQT